MIIQTKGQLKILLPDEGNVLFKKKDDNKEYFTKVFLAVSETEDDYLEVTKDYAFGLSTDKEYIKLKENYSNIKERIKLQSEIIDSILFPNSQNIKQETLVKYIIMRINDGIIDYNTAIENYPNLKDKLDELL